MIRVEMLTQNPYYILKDSNLITLGRRADKDACLGEWIMFPGNDIVDETATRGLWEKKYEYFKKCFLAEHSTIEVLSFRIVDNNARGDVVSQIVRATKGLPRYQVQSKRPDWNNGAKRLPPDEDFKMFASEWNPLAFMQMCRQRLCKNAMRDTRAWVCSVLVEMKNSDDPFFVALAECCVPQCVYRGNKCYELKPCGKCEVAK